MYGFSKKIFLLINYLLKLYFLFIKSYAFMKKVAIFPGSFDPFTKGHENIVLRGTELFDKIIVAIGNNSTKERHFSIVQRVRAGFS